MMRIAPLAVWGRNLTTEVELEAAVNHDVSFTHSRPEMTQLCTAYCVLIASLITNVDMPDKAVIAF